MCSAESLVPVERTITSIETPITSTVELLLEGELTSTEQQGITTEFPLTGFALEGVNLEDGVATLEFSDPQFSSSGGSCRVTILRAQIEQTALQFDAVDAVRIMPEEILQP
jgi:spore germination protein GerM